MPGVVIVAFLVGVAIVASDASRLLALVLGVALPVAFYVSLKPFAFILKCMLAVVFFIPFQYYDFLNLYKLINPLVVLGVFLGIKLFLRLVIEGKSGGYQVTAVDKFYFILLLSALVSSFFAISILGSLNWLFYSVTTGYFVYRAMLVLDLQGLKSILRFTVFAASLSALWGIGEYFTGYSLIYGRLIQGRLTSLFGHPLLSGLIFATVIPLSLSLYTAKREKVFLLTSAILFLAVVLTLARGSWLALAGGLLVMFSLLRFKLKIRLLFMLAIVVGSLLLIPQSNESVMRRLNESESARYSSFNVRKQAFPVAFGIIKDKPFFGSGPFNAGRYKEKYTFDYNLKGLSFENTYLDFLVELGIVGVIVLFFLGLSIARQVVFGMRGGQETDIYRSGAVAGLVILLINMAAFNFDFYRLFHFVTWFFIALNIAFSKYGSENQDYA